LASLLDFGQSSAPFIDSKFKTTGYTFWSATPGTTAGDYWTLNFNSNTAAAQAGSTATHYYRCVKSANGGVEGVAGQAVPVGRYSVSSGTVVDNFTQLTWQQVPTATCSTGCTWTLASTYCTNLPGSWRLPTIKELASLADFGASTAPLIDTGTFTLGSSTDFWSSDLVPGTTTYYALDFSATGGLIDSMGVGANGVLCVQ
jgi:hypothetical protein